MQLAIANYAMIMTDYAQLFVFCIVMITDEIVWLCLYKLCHIVTYVQYVCIQQGNSKRQVTSDM